MPIQVTHFVLLGPELECEFDGEDNARQEVCGIDELPPRRLELDGEVDQEKEDGEYCENRHRQLGEGTRPQAGHFFTRPYAQGCCFLSLP